MVIKKNTATLKYALVSEKKLNLIAKLVRGKPVVKAMEILHFLPRKAAKILLKVIKSGLSNSLAKTNHKPEQYFINQINIGRGPKINRMRYVAKSRVHPYVKHRSYVKVELEHF